MNTKSLYDVMAYTNDTETKYKVVHTETGKLSENDIISYIGCYSYDGDIDKIEVFNHTSGQNIILNYSETNTRIMVA